jgi:hypothetical protein
MASIPGDRDMMTGRMGRLAASSLLLQRLTGRWCVFGQTKCECREQRKTHDEREEDKMLLSHRSSPFFGDSLRDASFRLLPAEKVSEQVLYIKLPVFGLSAF